MRVSRQSSTALCPLAHLGTAGKSQAARILSFVLGVPIRGTASRSGEVSKGPQRQLTPARPMSGQIRRSPKRPPPAPARPRSGRSNSDTDRSARTPASIRPPSSPTLRRCSVAYPASASSVLSPCSARTWAAAGRPAGQRRRAAAMIPSGSHRTISQSKPSAKAPRSTSIGRCTRGPVELGGGDAAQRNVWFLRGRSRRRTGARPCFRFK